MVDPIYGDPSYRIMEVISPKTIRIRIEILDFKRFAEKILGIKEGGTLTLEKRASDRGIGIILSNLDSGSIKTLGGE